MNPFEIKDDQQYHAILDAVQWYRKKMLARRTNLVGTYWKQTTFKVSEKSTGEGYDTPEIVAYSYVTDVYGKTCELRISKHKDKVWLNTSFNYLHLDILKTKTEKTECISQEQFIAETAPLLKKYGMGWLKK